MKETEAGAFDPAERLPIIDAVDDRTQTKTGARIDETLLICVRSSSSDTTPIQT